MLSCVSWCLAMELVLEWMASSIGTVACIGTQEAQWVLLWSAALQFTSEVIESLCCWAHGEVWTISCWFWVVIGAATLMLGNSETLESTKAIKAKSTSLVCWNLKWCMANLTQKYPQIIKVTVRVRSSPFVIFTPEIYSYHQYQNDKVDETSQCQWSPIAGQITR